MTTLAKSSRPWPGATGAANAALESRTIADHYKPAFHVAGPPGMVAAMRDALSRTGIHADDIRSEGLYGY